MSLSDAEKAAGQFALLGQRRFLPFFLTQFLGAFNDNVFKNALIISIAFSASQVAEDEVNTLANLSAGLFILPFFLFSAIAGQLVDKYEKSMCIRRIKLAEILIMLCAAMAFYFHQIYWLIAILFVMGAQSTFFGPAKYSYIPQHLSQEELIAGNALVQSGTFVAILVGTMVGGILVAISDDVYVLSLSLVAIALAGYASSLFIPHTPAQDASLVVRWNPLVGSWNNLKYLFADKSLLVMVLGISWFWFLGATYLVQLPNYTKVVLGGDESVVTLLLTLFTLSVGAGALLCHRFSQGRIEMALVPLGCLGLTLFGIDLYFSAAAPLSTGLMSVAEFLQQSSHYRVLLDVVLIGMSSGLYIVPLFTLVQHRSEKGHLSRVIAGNNILNALFMVVASIMAILLLGNGWSIPELFLLLAGLNACVGLFLFVSEPEFISRLRERLGL